MRRVVSVVHLLLAASLVVTGCEQAGESQEPGASGGGVSAAQRMLPIVNSIGMKLAVIPAGNFQMGSPLEEDKRRGEEMPHEVEITEAFYMGVHEVTQHQFMTVMGENPSGVSGDTLPVQNVSWEQAVAFCRRLSERPDEKRLGRVYRLPTEAEWEYACRAGTGTATHFGDFLTSEQANFDGNRPYGSEETGTFLNKPAVVGSYPPNEFGLFDMHGNVWEWCSDFYKFDYYSEAPKEDPAGPELGVSRVMRGGSWYAWGEDCRSAYRMEFAPPLEGDFHGFRVAATLDPSARSRLAAAISVWRFFPLLLLVPGLGVIAALGSRNRLTIWHYVDLSFLALLLVMQVAFPFAPWLLKWMIWPAAVTLLWVATKYRLPQQAIVSKYSTMVLGAGLALTLAVRIATAVLSGPMVSWWSGLSISWLTAGDVPRLLALVVGVLLDLLLTLLGVLLGKKVQDWPFALGLGWAMLAVSPGGGQVGTVLLLAALLAVDRTKLVGMFFGLATAAYWPIAFVIPVWAAVQARRRRKEFLVSAAIALAVGIGAMVTLVVMRGQFLDPRLAGSSWWVRPLVGAISLGAVGAVMAVWPKSKSASTLRLATTLTLLGASIVWPDASSLGAALPWLAITLLGGSRTQFTPPPRQSPPPPPPKPPPKRPAKRRKP